MYFSFFISTGRYFKKDSSLLKQPVHKKRNSDDTHFSPMRTFSWALKVFGLMMALIGLVAWLPFFSKDMRLDLTGVVLFVVVGIIIYLIGGWLEKRIPPEKTKVIILNPNDLSFITKALNKQKRSYLIAGLSLLVFDILVLLAAINGNEDEKPPPLILIIFVIAILLLIAGVAILFLFKSFRLWNTNETKVYKKLTRTPHLITSLTAYFIQKDDAPGDLGLQILAELSIKDEKLDKINVSKEQLSLLRQYVELHNPNASYSEKEIRLYG